MLLENLYHLGKTLIELYENSRVYENHAEISFKEYLKDVSIYYDNPLAFHFESSQRKVLRCVISFLCTHFDSFNAEGCQKIPVKVCWLWKFIKFLTNSNFRGHKMQKMLAESNINFMKSAWNSFDSKKIEFFRSMISRRVKICSTFKIDPKPMKIFDVEISPPQSHIGERNILCYLVSAKKRQGMRFGTCKRSHEMSKSLLIYLHGGGFIATSSQTCKLSNLRRNFNENIEILDPTSYKVLIFD